MRLLWLRIHPSGHLMAAPQRRASLAPRAHATLLRGHQPGDLALLGVPDDVTDRAAIRHVERLAIWPWPAQLQLDWDDIAGLPAGSRVDPRRPRRRKQAQEAGHDGR